MLNAKRVVRQLFLENIDVKPPAEKRISKKIVIAKKIDMAFGLAMTK